MAIRDNYQNIQKSIESKLEELKRKKDDVIVVAVSKYQANNDIIELYDAGQRVFAESRVQEFRKKYEELDFKDVEWHMIGHLQTNKIKYIEDKVSLIHSLDSIKLAKEISKRVVTNNLKPISCLIQINSGEEENKTGFKYEDVESTIDLLKDLEGIRIKGIMVVAPIVENPEDVRPYFRKAKELFDLLKDKKIDTVEMKYLSMGMSHDYLVAIEEGANMVRIGSYLFS